MNQTFVKSVTEQLPQLGLLQDEPMKKHTTFRIGGPADYYAEPDMSRISKLIEMAKACDMPVTVIGNGSNLLVGDKGIRGLVIGIGKGLSEIEVTEAVAQQSTAQDLTAQDNGHIITAGAGAILAAVAAKAAEASLSGLEFASGIPGSVGGNPGNHRWSCRYECGSIRWRDKGCPNRCHSAHSRGRDKDCHKG